MKHVLLYSLLVSACAVSANLSAEEWEQLFDADLSKFEVYIGAPYVSVEGLPDDVEKTENIKKGKSMGLNNDPLGVFSTVEEDGEIVVVASGVIYGALSTFEEYENYHLQIQLKHTGKKHEPRLDKPCNSGVLYHCTGSHGKVFGTWKSCVEFQGMEEQMGAYLGLAGTKGYVRAADDVKWPPYDPSSETFTGGRVLPPQPLDKPMGEWNQLELYVVGDTAIQMVNGEIAVVVERIYKKLGKKADPKPVTKGNIQLQSEGSEVHFRRMQIRPITEFPAELLAKANLSTPESEETEEPEEAKAE